MSWKRLKNNQLQEQLKTRARIIQLIREFFIKEGFLEVETPILVPAAGQEPHLNPMNTRVWNERGRTHGAYLITSSEYAHKKLLAAGFEKTFEITRAFRAGEHWGGLHNPEFTILEWYRANADYTAIMDDVERLAQYVVAHLSPEQARRVKGPWERLTVSEAFEKYAKVSKEKRAFIYDRKFLRGLCVRRGYTVQPADRYDDLFYKIFLTEIEPKLGYPKPTILYDYPVSMASLARVKPSPPTPLPKGEGGRRPGEGKVAERFELYIAGMELANAFSELNDAKEQRRRFLEEQKLRKKLGKEIIPLDEDFLDAAGHMPPSAGIALGVDRLVMLLTGAARIEDVLAFPATTLWK